MSLRANEARPLTSARPVLSLRRRTADRTLPEWLKSLDPEEQKILGDDIRRLGSHGQSVCRLSGLSDETYGK